MARFSKMQTEEERYAAQCAGRVVPAPSRPVDHSTWRSMSAEMQAAHLARLDGREDEARSWEEREAELTAPAEPKVGLLRRLLG